MTEPSSQPALLDVGDPLGTLVSAAALAECLGVDIRSIQDWDKAGTISRKERGCYVLRDVLRGVYWWQRELINKKKGPEGSEFEELEKREQKAKTEKAELEVQRIKGELISAEEVKQAAFDRARLLRDTLENIPSRISATLAAQMDEQQIKLLLTREINQALEEMSR